ncbi:hypothetical protein [Herbaspirillum sp. YR522]|uniref:hypothetical protein n=1 Tax=Herbaspirillum sp. YR522 TaxID=1144342 RepID=UPI00026FC473|nr:hypothetical protein [Herbaspirillum sp. YR522]EJN09604.1 hypothetical protein PMI40_00612 [Herbaspirillum sp. YR522]
MPSITIYIADRGTERTNGEPATVGHMWYSLDNGKGEKKHFSFYQNINIVPEDASGFRKLFTPGYFYNTDGEKYKNPDYSRTIALTQDQYAAVATFSEDPEAAGFSKNYNAFTNSCIDFVWAALHAAGINPTNFEAISGHGTTRTMWRPSAAARSRACPCGRWTRSPVYLGHSWEQEPLRLSGTSEVDRESATREQKERVRQSGTKLSILLPWIWMATALKPKAARQRRFSTITVTP